MTGAPLKTGTRVSVSKTVSESDVYLFAGITGDLSPNHVDEVFMRGTQYGRRIAHGALIDPNLIENRRLGVTLGIACAGRHRPHGLPKEWHRCERRRG